MARSAADFAREFMLCYLLNGVEKAQFVSSLDEANCVFGENCSPLERRACVEQSIGQSGFASQTGVQAMVKQAVSVL